MEDLVKKLSEICGSCVRLSDVIRYENQVFSAELEERNRLGLHGDDAIQHFNEWMVKFGLNHMVVQF